MSLRVLPSLLRSTAPTRAVYGWPDCAVKIALSDQSSQRARRSEALEAVGEPVRVVDAARHEPVPLIVVANGAVGVEVRRVRRVLHVVAGVARDDRGGVGHGVFDLAERVGGAELQVVREAGR